MQLTHRDRAPVVDILHGVSVSDPYRWLEIPGSAPTTSWLTEQQQRLHAYYLAGGSLERIATRARELVDIETIDQIAQIEGRLFFRRRHAGEQQPSIAVREGRDQPERVLVSAKASHPYSSLKIHRISDDGSLLAYETKHGGEHTKAIQIVDTVSGNILPDGLPRGVARGLVFCSQNKGYAYCHEQSASLSDQEQYHTVKFHQFGGAPEDDQTLFRLPRTQHSKLVLTTSGSQLIILYFRNDGGQPVADFYSTANAQLHSWYQRLRGVHVPFVPLFYKERLFLLRWNSNINGEIIELGAADGQESRVVISDVPKPISDCWILGDYICVQYSSSTTPFWMWSIAGTSLCPLPLSSEYTWRAVRPLTCEVQVLFLKRESTTSAPSLFCLAPDRMCLTPMVAMKSPKRDFTSTRTITYASTDGSDIEMSLTGFGDAANWKDHPVIMTAYGGFGAVVGRRFSPFVYLLMEAGFLFASPEIRGGGERGPAWHDAGRRLKRQTSFDDFIDGAEWLVRSGITTASKLAAFGGSNSALLVAAVITQRPHLFRAGLCIAPLLDMVRFQLFDRADVWSAEYGTSDNPEEFRALLKYSPYHNVKDGINYPSLLFVSGDLDSRCNPAHARKMVARLQNHVGQKNPILLDYSAERGHSPTMPLSVRLDGIAKRVAFLCRELGVSFA